MTDEGDGVGEWDYEQCTLFETPSISEYPCPGENLAWMDKIARQSSKISSQRRNSIWRSSAEKSTLREDRTEQPV